VRDETVGEASREFEEGVAGEIVAEVCEDRRMRSSLLDDLDRVQILEYEEMDPLERLGHATYRQSRTDDESGSGPSSDPAQQAMGLRFPP
jgi:hypothetical protein